MLWKPPQQESFGRRLTSVRRRFISQGNRLTVLAGVTLKVVDEAANRVNLQFWIEAASTGIWIRPIGYFASNGWLVGTSPTGIIEFEIDKHYDLLGLKWVCQNTTGVGGVLYVSETFYKGI